MSERDVVIVGAGHNGLVAATLLARQGLRVEVLEAASVVGGACRTEHPFEKAPGVGQSTGAYLLGLVPPQLLRDLGVSLPLIRRDPHYFLPTTSERHLLLGADGAANRAQIASMFSERDARAHDLLEAELGALREDVAPAWLQAPHSVEETAQRFVRPALRERFLGLCRGSVTDYLASFGFESELLVAMYAVTDGLTGLSGGPDAVGSGMNFLVHNLCRLPGSDGTWMVVRGGMGTVTRELARAAERAGASIVLGSKVDRIDVEAGVARGVTLADGRRVRATAVVCNADPFATTGLLGEACPAELRERIERYRIPGHSMKVNLCLSELPAFPCLPEPRGQHGATIHLLPEHDTLRRVTAAFEDCSRGRLPADPTIEWYIHTTLDPSLRDDAGRHSAALFVQWVPYALSDGSWADREAAYVDHLLEICDRFAPGTSDRVVDAFVLSPPAIESHFGITGGHIHHVDHRFAFDERLPYRLPIEGLYACGAGCHPAGSVIGAAGHNAARVLLDDLAIPS